jgi:hypothetical protein
VHEIVCVCSSYVNLILVFIIDSGKGVDPLVIERVF